MPNPLLGTTTVGAETFTEAMDEARRSSSVKAIVVRVNSPGGFAPAADVMWRAMKLAAEEKPVVVSMCGVAASGGYWIATAADTIVADPLTITGSIGVFSTFFDLSGLWEDKIGITFDAVRTSPYADMFSGMRPLTDAEQRLLQASVDSTYQQFLRKVAGSRGLTVDSVEALAQGRVWMGTTARDIGLVDVLGSLEEAVDLAAERAGLDAGSYSRRVLPQPRTLFEELSSSLNARAASAWMNFRTTPAERRLLEQARLLQQVTDDHGAVQARLPVNLTIH
jgi:protease-4